MDHGDRRTPIALPRDPPVADPKVLGLPSLVPLLQPLRNGLEGGLGGQTIKGPGILEYALFDIGRGLDIHARTIRRIDHLFDRDAVLAGKGVIPLVVARHRHHRPGTVAHEDEVCRIDGHRLTTDWMDRLNAQGHALLLDRLQLCLGGTATPALLHEGSQLWVVSCGLQCEWVLTCHGHIGDPHEGVRTGGEDRQDLFRTFY